MNEHSDTNRPPSTGTDDIVTALRDMRQQLLYLEKKIDTLIAQSSQRSSVPRPQSEPWGRPSKVKHFSKSFRPRESSHSHSHSSSHSGEKKYGASYGGGKPSFDKKKKFFTPGRRAPRDR